MDPYRLPRFARPTRYDLRLEPDLATLSFAGEETVTLEITEPTAEIVMNAVELKIGEATITSERGTAPVEGEFAEGKLQFWMTMEGGGGSMTLNFSGAMKEDGSMAGTIDIQGYQLQWSATRAKGSL